MEVKQNSEQLLFEMMQAYANQALKTEVFGLLTGLLMAFFFWGEHTQSYLLYWSFVLVSGPLVHHAIVYRFHQSKFTVTQTLYILRGFWFCSGCLWGSFVWICLDTSDSFNMTILTGLVAGVLIGGIPGASMLRHVYIYFAVPFILIYSLAMFTDASDVEIMGVLGLIMLGLVLMLSYQFYEEFKRSIALRFENKMMMQSLQQQKKAADKANQDKTQFLAAASHDLRQPHQAIGLFIEALDHLETEPGKKAILAKTKQAFKAMSSLLEQLLDISKLDSASVQADKQAIALQPLLHQVVMEHMGEAEQKGIELRLRVTQTVVFTDASMLMRIVSNLVTNAIRYTEEGGVLVAVRRREGQLWLDIIDTGCGIPESKQQDIFKEFTQLHNPERDREKGLGLGLAIVQRLVHILDTELVLQSQVGRGSCFSLRLQEKRKADIQSEQQPLSQVVSFQGLSVVVIDDDKIALDGMQTLLTAWGCQVLPFLNQDTCLNDLEAQNICPDILIVDYRLQEQQTGLTYIDAIYQHCQQKIPTLIVTGDTDPERIREVQQIGIPLLHKPVEPHALRTFLIQAQSNRL